MKSTPTNAPWTTWSISKLITGTAISGINLFDQAIYYANGAYFCIYRDLTNDTINCMKCTGNDFTQGWNTVLYDGQVTNWLGLGVAFHGTEGCALVKDLPGKNWLLYLDYYNANTGIHVLS